VDGGAGLLVVPGAVRVRRPLISIAPPGRPALAIASWAILSSRFGWALRPAGNN